MREKPKLSMPPNVVPVAKPQENEVITQVREYKLITPLFGGGVTAGEIDPVTPIRGTEIRGQLRFWWRACRGGQFEGKIKKMKEAEDALWGKAYEKGEKAVKQEQLVQISVEILQIGEIKKPFTIEKNPRTDKNQSRLVVDVPPYAAFSFQPSQEELRNPQTYTKTVLTNTTFKLTISFSEKQRIDVEAAIWAWETFGGLGARTRRGFGALLCIGIKENERPLPVSLPLGSADDVQQWLEEQLNKYITKDIWPENVPHFAKKLTSARNIKVIDGYVEASRVWKYLINRLQSFRQMRREPNDSQRQGKRTQGASLWPEPDSIRELTGNSYFDNASSADITMMKFPRAVFGLPIVFHFIGNKEPSDTSLELEQAGQERFASPLILKPLACSQNSYIGLAVVLEGTYFDEKKLILKYLKPVKKVGNVSASLDGTQKLTLQDNVQISKQTNALQAFMKYL